MASSSGKRRRPSYQRHATVGAISLAVEGRPSSYVCTGSNQGANAWSDQSLTEGSLGFPRSRLWLLSA